MAKNCIYCGAELTECGNSESRFEETAVVEFLKCPNCGRDYEVSDPPKEDRESIYRDYWNPLPNIEGEIIIYKNDKNKNIIESVGCKFDENDECEVTMLFSDGIAKSFDGKLEMTYPTIEQVKKSANMQNEIISYTGRCEIDQFDIALKYGELRNTIQELNNG